MGRQRAENLLRDRYEKDISEDRWGERGRFYIGISRKRQRGREENSKSRDLGNRSLKTDGGQTVENLHRHLSKERKGKRGKEREQRSELQVS